MQDMRKTDFLELSAIGLHNGITFFCDKAENEILDFSRTYLGYSDLENTCLNSLITSQTASLMFSLMKNNETPMTN
jgi:hypothetical protein